MKFQEGAPYIQTYDLQKARVCCADTLHGVDRGGGNASAGREWKSRRASLQVILNLTERCVIEPDRTERISLNIRLLAISVRFWA